MTANDTMSDTADFEDCLEEVEEEQGEEEEVVAEEQGWRWCAGVDASVFGRLPREIQRMVLGLLASDRPVATCLPVAATYSSRVARFYTATRQDYSALAAATRVCRDWRQVASEPSLWRDFRLPITSSREAEEVLEALQYTRFQLVTKVNWVTDSLLDSEEVQYGVQTRVEVLLEHEPPEVVERVRRVLETPAGKVRLHTRIKAKSPYLQNFPVLDPSLDQAQPARLHPHNAPFAF